MLVRKRVTIPFLGIINIYQPFRSKKACCDKTTTDKHSLLVGQLVGKITPYQRKLARMYMRPIYKTAGLVTPTGPLDM